MKCDEAAEYVSALCDGETIPRAAAEHVGACESCQARLQDFAAMGVELRRLASLETADDVQERIWARPQNRFAIWWQKGWGPMRIPRLAFAVLIACIVVLGSTLAVVKVRAHGTGTVVLLNTAGPNGPLMDCPLSTVDKNQSSCIIFVNVARQVLSYKVNLLSRDGGRILLAIRTRTSPVVIGTHSYSPFELDALPAKEVWFEPGEQVKIEVPDIGTLILTGEWLDHVPVLVGMRKSDLSPGPNEVRFASPLILKDKAVVGDLAGATGGILSTDDFDRAITIYIPGEGQFLISQLPMKGAMQAHVEMGRISFDEDGHSWQIVNSVPVSREDHIWVLHQSDFKVHSTGRDEDTSSFGILKLVQTEPGVWVPGAMPN